MRILVADDQSYNRELLSYMLEDEGHEIIEAENGLQAQQLYQENSDISMILMDVNMPEMDGISATNAIRTMNDERFVAIIFVTALDDADVLGKCLEAGGDDFVPKPVNESVLIAKINAHKRSQTLYQNLRVANESLNYHKTMMDREHAIVERVFSRGMDRMKTDCDNVEKYTSPASMFDGDLVLVSPSPSGGVYVLVGDFTGHGLAASIGSLPVTEIFYSFAARQTSVSQIVSEINTRLCELLPTNMFFCACILYMNHAGKNVLVWAGGMNDIYSLRPGGNRLECLEGTHMPLGVLPPEEFDDRPTLFEVPSGTHLFVFTDGVNEAQNEAREEFGLDRLQELLLEGGGEGAIARVTDAVHKFTEGAEQTDDISMANITVAPVVHRSKETGEIVDVVEDLHSGKSFPWSFKMRLEGEELRNTSIVNQILDFVSSIQGIELHQDKIFTIVSELYSNALEHGVLGLESSIKSSPDGFDEYYRLRAEGLENIGTNFIDLHFEYIKGQPNKVKLVITDSGIGFDYVERARELESDEESHGRGINLLDSLCASLDYSNEGRTVTAEYELKRHV